MDLSSLLYEALASPYGIIVATPDPEFLRQKLYPLRKATPCFLPLAFVIQDKDLWILNRGTPDE